ncbi:MAG: TVP38/TMEM64 family protein [Rhodobiaceae bacterium]|nr:TVP38/TMEM64 family protein [Rhodobiaceae bacterium]
MGHPVTEKNGSAAATEQGRRSWSWRRIAPLFVLIALAGLAFAMGWHRFLSFETLAMNREALRGFVAGNWPLALAAYAGIYIAVVALSLPGGALLTISGGLLFGWLAGGLVTVVAATIGASILFLIARSALGEPLAARAGPWLGKLRSGFQEDALNYLLFLRLVPAFPFWLVNLAPALLGVSLRLFVLGTFFGIIPGTFTFAIVGSGLDSIIDAQLAANPNCLSGGECAFRLDTGALVTREILIAFAALGIIALLPVIIKRVRARRRSST